MKVYVWCFNVDFFLFGPNDLRLTILGCQATDSIQPHVTTKGITQTIYTDSEPPSQIPNSLMPSVKLRSANLPFLHLWCDAVGDRTSASRTSSGRSNHNTTQRWFHRGWEWDWVHLMHIVLNYFISDVSYFNTGQKILLNFLLHCPALTTRRITLLAKLGEALAQVYEKPSCT